MYLKPVNSRWVFCSAGLARCTRIWLVKNEISEPESGRRVGARPETAVCPRPAELAELRGEAEQAVGVFASDDLCRVLRVPEVNLRGRGVTKRLGVIFGGRI